MTARRSRSSTPQTFPAPSPAWSCWRRTSWNDVWCDPAFRAWNIEALLPRIACPVLAVQGEDDEYGTLAQVSRLRREAPQTEVVTVQSCGHSPHRDQPERLTREVVRFFDRHFRDQRRCADSPSTTDHEGG